MLRPFDVQGRYPLRIMGMERTRHFDELPAATEAGYVFYVDCFIHGIPITLMLTCTCMCFRSCMFSLYGENMPACLRQGFFASTRQIVTNKPTLPHGEESSEIRISGCGCGRIRA